MLRPEVADRSAPGGTAIVRQDRSALGGVCPRTSSQHLDRSLEFNGEVVRIPNGVETTLESR